MGEGQEGRLDWGGHCTPPRAQQVRSITACHARATSAAGCWLLGTEWWWKVGVPGGQGTSHGALLGRRPSREGSHWHIAVIPTTCHWLALIGPPGYFNCTMLLNLSKCFKT